MTPNFYYLLRSKRDGKYLLARSAMEEGQEPKSFLLLFSADYDALSYLQTHGAEVRDRFAVETQSSQQIKDLAKRWGFIGIALVKDPLIPTVDFLVFEP